MDQLEVWNKTEGHLFFGRLDLDHIGDFGHSAGGMIVSRIPHMDKRVKAIVLNDSWVGASGGRRGDSGPHLHVGNHAEWKAQSETAYVRKAKPGIQMKLLGAEHASFTDLAVIQAFARPGDGKAFNNTVRAVLREFFGQYLLGKPSQFLEKGSAKYPLVKIEARRAGGLWSTNITEAHGRPCGWTRHLSSRGHGAER